MGSPQDTTSAVGRRAFIVDREALILVTGANGYIGSKVVRALLELGFKTDSLPDKADQQAGQS